MLRISSEKWAKDIYKDLECFQHFNFYYIKYKWRYYQVIAYRHLKTTCIFFSWESFFGIVNHQSKEKVELYFKITLFFQKSATVCKLICVRPQLSTRRRFKQRAQPISQSNVRICWKLQYDWRKINQSYYSKLEVLL